MRKLTQTGVTFGFVALLSGAALISVLWPEKGFSQEENRYLQKLPEFSWESLLDGSYGEKYEKALSDQFPLRNDWVGLKVLSERAQGKMDVNGVYFGKENYLIEKFETEDLRTEQAKKNIRAVADAAGRWEELLGSAHTRVMLVPSAGGVLKEKLPFLAAPYNQRLVVDDIKAQVGNEGLFVSVDSVLDAHRTESLYYRTDHHWTSLGAYYGYTAWAESIGLTPYAKEDFSVSTVSDSFRGTIQSKVNVAVPADTIEIYEPKAPVEYEVYYDLEDTPHSGLYNMEILATKDQYRVFLDGNHALTQIENRTLQQQGGTGSERKLLIIKDSFAHTFAPFAADHFGTTYLLDLRYYNGKPEEFAREQGITDLLILYQIPGFCNERTVGKL